MNLRKSLVLLLSALALLMIVGPGAFADDGGARQAQVTRLEGELSMAAAAQGPWKILTLKDWIPEGRFIRTGEKSRAELSLPDGSAIRVAPATTIELSHLYFPKRGARQEFDAKILAGRFWAKVRKLAGGESFFKVRTSTAVAGVRGTAFQVSYDGSSQSSTFKVYEGKVAVNGVPPAPTYQSFGPPREVSGPQEVPGPHEVSREEWERIVSSWQYLTVGANGQPSAPQDINPDADLKQDDFSAWNVEIDDIALPSGEAPAEKPGEKAPEEPKEEIPEQPPAGEQ